MDLKKKTMLVTGSSSGIGKAIAIEAAKEGAHVLVHYRKNKDGALETLGEIEKYSTGKIYSADLSELDQVGELFKLFEQDSEKIDVLINNAGEAISGELDNFELWDAQWRNIFMSQVYVTNSFVSSSDTKEIRKILNVSSIYGLFEMGDVDFPQYSAAKAAVNSLTLNLAKKYSPLIQINAIAPGWVWTPAWEGTSDAEQEKLKSLTKIKRFIEPEEIAKFAVAILKNDSITGEILRVDGGLHFPTLS